MSTPCIPCTACPPNVSYVLADCASGEPCTEIVDAACVKYTGPNLPQYGIVNGDRLKGILIKLLKYNTNTNNTAEYTVLVNDKQSKTVVEYLDDNRILASVTVNSSGTAVIDAFIGSPVIMSGTGFLAKGLIEYTSSAGATSSGTTITVASTAGIIVGRSVFVYSGTGAFAPNTLVVAVVNATTFTVTTAPTVPLSGGSTIIKVYA